MVILAASKAPAMPLWTTITSLVLTVIAISFSLFTAIKTKRNNSQIKNILFGLELLVIAALVIIAFPSVILATGLSKVGGGNFGQWLGYSGNIIGALVAALVSYWVTTTTRSKLNMQKVKQEYQFKIQTQHRQDLIKKFHDVQIELKWIDVVFNDMKKYCKLYEDGEQITKPRFATHSNYNYFMLTQPQRLVAVLHDTVEDSKKKIDKGTSALNNITDDPDYPIFSQMEVDGKRLKDLIDELEKLTELYDGIRIYAEPTTANANSKTDPKVGIQMTVVSKPYSDANGTISNVTDKDIRGNRFYKDINKYPKPTPNGASTNGPVYKKIAEIRTLLSSFAS